VAAQGDVWTACPVNLLVGPADFGSLGGLGSFCSSCMVGHKIIDFSEAGAVFERLRAEGKTIVQCHGTFDLIHPGHIYHLKEAKAYGDVLVVTVTADS
jgi:hypothetical protein